MNDDRLAQLNQQFRQGNIANEKSRAALARLKLLMDTDNENGTYSSLIRNLLTSDLDTLHHYDDIDEARTMLNEDDDLTDDDIRAVISFLHDLVVNPYFTDELSALAMAFSLCPLHFVDWAICFDDEDPTCSQIRAIFPNGHDT